MNGGEFAEADAALVGVLAERCSENCMFSSCGEARDTISKYSYAVGRCFFVLRADKTRLELCCGQPCPAPMCGSSSETVPTDALVAVPHSGSSDFAPTAAANAGSGDCTPTVVLAAAVATSSSQKRKTRCEVKHKNTLCAFHFTVRQHFDGKWYVTAFHVHSCLPLGKPVCFFLSLTCSEYLTVLSPDLFASQGDCTNVATASDCVGLCNNSTRREAFSECTLVSAPCEGCS